VKRMKKRLIGKKRSMIDEQTQLALDENLDDDDFDVEGKEEFISEYFGPWQVEPYRPGEAKAKYSFFFFATVSYDCSFRMELYLRIDTGMFGFTSQRCCPKVVSTFNSRI
jgi:hypothetical protein